MGAAGVAWVTLYTNDQPARAEPPYLEGHLPPTSSGGWSIAVVVRAPSIYLLKGCPSDVAVEVRFGGVITVRRGEDPRIWVVTTATGLRNIRWQNDERPGLSPPIRVKRGSWTVISASARELFGERDGEFSARLSILRLTFRAPWIHRRAQGSCWVSAPSLIDEDGRSRPGEPEITSEAAPDYSAPGAARSAQTRIEPTLNISQSIPPATALGRGWTCRPTQADPEALGRSDCAAFVAVDAPSRSAARDLGLLLCGVLLSLAVEFLVRAAFRER